MRFVRPGRALVRCLEPGRGFGGGRVGHGIGVAEDDHSNGCRAPGAVSLAGRYGPTFSFIIIREIHAVGQPRPRIAQIHGAGANRLPGRPPNEGKQ